MSNQPQTKRREVIERSRDEVIERSRDEVIERSRDEAIPPTLMPMRTGVN